MIYIVYLLYSFFIFKFVDVRNTFSYVVGAVLVAIPWIVIIGGQYNVGADYFPYLYFFSSPTTAGRFEPIFTFTSVFLYDIGIEGQFQFFFFAFVNAFCFFAAVRKLNISRVMLFFFLFVTVSTLFNNQMNGIRQCVATFIVFWAFVEFYDSKVTAVLLIILAAGFHYSALVCLPFFFFKKIVLFATKKPKLLLLLTLVVTLLPLSEVSNQYIFAYMPEFLREETSYMTMYEGNDYYNEQVGLQYKLSKLLLLPVYYLSLDILNKDCLTDKERLFFLFGLLAYSLRCILLMNNLVGRFSYYFWLPSILPIYYYVKYLFERNLQLKAVACLAYSSIIYFIKVIMAVNEYKYEFFV